MKVAVCFVFVGFGVTTTDFASLSPSQIRTLTFCFGTYGLMRPLMRTSLPGTVSVALPTW